MNKFFISLLIAIVAGSIHGVDRASAAIFFVKMYERSTGSPAHIAETPFNDLGDLSKDQADAVAKLYGIGVTIGTSASTYSPHDPLLPYQFFLMLGKTLMKIGNS